jgi:ribosomal-protein-alanine N-acetyltransferase
MKRALYHHAQGSAIPRWSQPPRKVMKHEANRQPILETERLRLQPFASADAALLFPLMDDPEVMAYWDVPEIDDPDLITAIVEDQVAAMDAGRAIHWGIRTLASDGFVGCCSVTDIDGWHKRGEVGFLLGREAWGQGYGLEAIGAVVGYAGASGLRKLAARTHLGNRRSELLLEKLGFKREGLLRGHIVRDGQRRDCHLFGLLL